MNSTQQKTRGSGRSTLVLSLVLALLALACLPVLAQADSSEIQYDPVPNGPGGNSEHETIAKKSSEKPQTNGGAEAPANTGSNEPSESYSEEESSESETGAVAPGNNGGNGNSGQSNPGKSANSGQKVGLQAAAPVTKSTQSSSGGGGSSPLVPILIAITVLAAISIGVVMIRQRRQRDGSSPSSLSTKAG